MTLASAAGGVPWALKLLHIHIHAKVAATITEFVAFSYFHSKYSKVRILSMW
jgi:hypothetical protein